jgi:ABC-2 type transport system ATP-binding protein
MNIKTTKTGAELRIISIEKPTEDAVAVEKNLEDKGTIRRSYRRKL